MHSRIQHLPHIQIFALIRHSCQGQKHPPDALPPQPSPFFSERGRLYHTPRSTGHHKWTASKNRTNDRQVHSIPLKHPPQSVCKQEGHPAQFHSGGFLILIFPRRSRCQSANNSLHGFPIFLWEACKTDNTHCLHIPGALYPNIPYRCQSIPEYCHRRTKRNHAFSSRCRLS